ncbi:hypothetical protein [Metaclostridioides mangenotii]|uniref:hypothetical protein n=1 Tax=Metaclostridioides mangenotii TaxID=1540 RepID=UPI000B144850|nr:hypothetical protein [Clostridioides mangenotii]
MKMKIKTGDGVTEYEFKNVNEYMEFLRAMDIYSKVKEMEDNFNVMDFFDNRNGIN